MGRDRRRQQLLLSPPITGRPMIVPVAVFGRRRPEATEALEIAMIAERALQAFGRSVHPAKLAGAPDRSDIRRRFQHIAKSLCPDPQPVTMTGVHVVEIAPLADQPPVPALEFMLAVGFQ